MSLSWIPAIAGLAFLASACANDVQGTETEIVVVGDKQLVLVVRGDDCSVRLDQGEEIALGLRGPCAYLRRGGAESATVHQYTDVGFVVIVAGAPTAQETYREDDRVTPEDRCSDSAQGVVVNKGAIRLGSVQESRLSFCPAMGLDEKVYYGIAYPGD